MLSLPTFGCALKLLKFPARFLLIKQVELVKDRNATQKTFCQGFPNLYFALDCCLVMHIKEVGMPINSLTVKPRGEMTMPDNNAAD